MNASTSLIPELENVIQHGTPARCAEMLHRITGLFVEGATRFSEAHIGLFDDVLCQLVSEIEIKARSELSQRLAPIANAPTQLVRQLAHDNDISVAGPVLKQSTRLKEDDLVDIAETKGQAHLQAISGRKNIGEAVTDVLVRRGDLDVARSVAENPTARFSNDAFSALVNRAEKDGVLAEKVGKRPDIPAHLFRELLMRATDVVQRRLLATAKPETQAEIRRVLAKITQELHTETLPRDYTFAQRTVLALHQSGKLGEPELVDFANSKKFEETVATLSALSGVPIEAVDRLAGGERPDPVLILCKAVGFSWATARAIIAAHPGSKTISNQALDSAYSNFERLSPTTAQRVVRFWQVRQAHEVAREF
jgi:uncharacterized protein (DUF2336 family)